MLPDHRSKDAFVTPVKKLDFFNNLIVNYLFSGLNHWDGQYYTDIAKRGYDTEEKLVFLPVYPLCLRLLSVLLQQLSLNFLSIDSCIIFSSILLNISCFVGSSLCLFYLTKRIFPSENESFAEETVLWFAFNPASIFFSANYTESLYSFATFFGLLCLYSSFKVIPGVLFGASTLIRSNGLLNTGFIGFLALNTIQSHRWSRMISLVMMSVVSIIPFYIYQKLYIIQAFCPRFPFCSKYQRSFWHTIPYNLLQEKYWNQGFLRYWRLKQFPNFLICAFVFVLVFWSVVRFFVCLQSKKVPSTNVKQEKRSIRILSNASLIPFALHVSFICLYSLLFTHVQVMTRLIASSSPWIYWVSSSLETNTIEHKLVKTFFTSYFFLGIAMFANGYPWTWTRNECFYRDKIYSVKKTIGFETRWYILLLEDVTIE